MAHILLVENEISFANLMKLELEYAYFSVTICHQAFQVFNLLSDSVFDLIIIPGDLADFSGLKLCRQLRQQGCRTPIILLTPHDTIGDRVAALDAGADDYLMRDFSIEELFLRIKANLGVTPQKDLDVIKFADIRLNPQTREVYRGQRLVDLTTREFELLSYLIGNPQQVLTREQILAQVWDDNFKGYSTNIIEVYIRYLRLKLEAQNEKRLIQTVRGVGYVLQEKMS